MLCGVGREKGMKGKKREGEECKDGEWVGGMGLMGW